MKSKEEFIAGIYEKAANYAEEEKKTKSPVWAFRMAAAAAVLCVVLAGFGATALRHGNGTTPPDGNDGITLFSDVPGEEDGVNPANFRMLPEQGEIRLAGTLDSVDAQEGILWILLEFWDETSMSKAEYEEKFKTKPEIGALAAIAWDLPEAFPEELAIGTRLMAAGEAGTYGGGEAARYGAAQLVLSDSAKLWIWAEEENAYQNMNSEGQE